MIITIAMDPSSVVVGFKGGLFDHRKLGNMRGSLPQSRCHNTTFTLQIVPDPRVLRRDAPNERNCRTANDESRRVQRSTSVWACDLRSAKTPTLCTDTSSEACGTPMERLVFGVSMA